MLCLEFKALESSFWVAMRIVHLLLVSKDKGFWLPVHGQALSCSMQRRKGYQKLQGVCWLLLGCSLASVLSIRILIVLGS